MRVSPCSESSTAGTSQRGVRSVVVRCGGELERMPVLDVGTGVGYFKWARPVFWRLAGRGRPGDEERGSKGGRRDGAGRLVPAMEGETEDGGGMAGSVGSIDSCLCGEESMMSSGRRLGEVPLDAIASK